MLSQLFFISLIAIAYAHPPFLNNVSEEGRREFEAILQNRSIADRRAVIDQWAAKYNVVSQLQEFRNGQGQQGFRGNGQGGFRGKQGSAPNFGVNSNDQGFNGNPQTFQSNGQHQGAFSSGQGVQGFAGNAQNQFGAPQAINQSPIGNNQGFFAQPDSNQPVNRFRQQQTGSNAVGSSRFFEQTHFTGNGNRFGNPQAGFFGNSNGNQQPLVPPSPSGNGPQPIYDPYHDYAQQQKANQAQNGSQDSPNPAANLPQPRMPMGQGVSVNNNFLWPENNGSQDPQIPAVNLPQPRMPMEQGVSANKNFFRPENQRTNNANNNVETRRIRV